MPRFWQQLEQRSFPVIWAPKLIWGLLRLVGQTVGQNIKVD